MRTAPHASALTMLCAGTLVSLIAVAASTEGAARLDIELANGTAPEEAARRQLIRLVDEYDVESWVFTREILIDEEQRIPHSHPVLTMNPRYLEDDMAQLATLVHAQLHWYANDVQEKIDAGMEAFRDVFPQVPGGRAGARNEYSTYLHLIICDLEYQAMTKLIGRARAREVLESWNHYTWVYDQVLNNPEVREVNLRLGLTPP